MSYGTWHMPLVKHGPSSHSTMNVLWQHPSTTRGLYIMDNHRAAYWCWARHVGKTDPYELFHLDWHWDAAPVEDPDRLRSADLGSLDSFLNFLALGRTILGGEHPRAIRWDNYIDSFLVSHPNATRAHFCVQQPEHMAHAKVLEGIEKNEFWHYSQASFFEQFSDLLEEERPGRRIVNVDLDYFFLRVENKRVLMSELLAATFRTIGQRMGRIDVLTIALSPECCAPRYDDLAGGWRNAELACGIACEGLGIANPFA